MTTDGFIFFVILNFVDIETIDDFIDIVEAG